MDIKDWITIGAVIIGPILAVQAQKIIENITERKRRKLQLFHTLMETRATRLSGAHVSALNMIDLEFYGKSVLVNVGSPKLIRKLRMLGKYITII
ncbi:DUF6680 family protein [Vibrio parahaemolyticus]|uniref:DUF6680 family protein n=1 Tax=Vibrio parahaemolyticus TaxID=670 RepID=UPI001F37994E|nr:DUF6680 family protein [Vibrio parahaemolyticus]MCG0019452.1 hypothetical protein [Vibrio parahaemolyticus]